VLSAGCRVSSVECRVSSAGCWVLGAECLIFSVYRQQTRTRQREAARISESLSRHTDKSSLKVHMPCTQIGRRGRLWWTLGFRVYGLGEDCGVDFRVGNRQLQGRGAPDVEKVGEAEPRAASHREEGISWRMRDATLGED